MKSTYKKLHGILAGFFRFVLRVKIKGQENEPSEGPLLICSNHVTLADPIAICASLRKIEPHYMAKKELFKVPVLSWIIKILGAYPVNRGGGDIGAIHKSIDILKDGGAVGIFPQGTRCKCKRIEDTEFKNGAALICSKVNVPILPIKVDINKNKWALFKRINIIIGKPIAPAELIFDSEKPRNEELSRITKIIFDRIVELG